MGYDWPEHAGTPSSADADGAATNMAIASATAASIAVVLGLTLMMSSPFEVRLEVVSTGGQAGPAYA